MDKRKVKSILTWAALGLFVLALGYQEEARSYSCHLCRNTRTDKTIRFFWVPLRSSARTSNHYVAPAGHKHNWFHYTNYEMLGLRGLLTFRLGCSTKMYRDNKLPGYNIPEPKRSPA